MKDIKITGECYLPRRQVKYYVAYKSNAVKGSVRELRKSGKLVDFSGGKSIAAVIYLITGEAIAVNTSIETLRKRMEQSEEEVE